ncbi:unnamed protein product [Rotaria sp. Silwood1]|nr:unnamed protein product [Rotaria sp. Silwood1]
MEMFSDRRVIISSSRCSSHRSPNTKSYESSSLSRYHQSCYTILSGPDNPRQLVDCQIILVNPRQNYGEEISSRLVCHGLITSIILLREDYTLIEAIENAAHEQCLYGIIVMPMHEERRTASFHILHSQTEEHRNLTLEDGYHIILTNFARYKENIRNEEINRYDHENIQSMIYSQSKENLNQEKSNSLNEYSSSFGDKLPLSMLLCLLADGRQLTLDEVDRILVYLLEKKAKMLTLPQGTLPPLPIQYANIKTNHQTDSCVLSDRNCFLTKEDLSSSELSSTIAEQIRQIISTDIIKSSYLNSNEQFDIENRTKKNSFDSLSNIIKYEDNHNLQTNIHFKQGRKDLNDYQQNFQSSSSSSSSSGQNILSQDNQNQTLFSYTKSNENNSSIVTPTFHYSSTIPTNQTSSNSFISSYDSIAKTLTIKSPLKQTTTTSTTISDSVCKSSEYMYPSTSITNQNLYQTMPNSAAADAAAAIFQAYSQFNNRTTSIPSMINQQTNIQPQQQIRK